MLVAGLAARNLAVHSARSAVLEGAKNHTAAGLKVRMRGRARERSAPQFMKPMPRGRVLFVVLRGLVVVLALRRRVACFKCVERSETSVPAPMKPMPPVWD